MTAGAGQSIMDIAVEPAYPDRVRSRYTGWTRATWRALADAALAAVRPYAAPGHARIDLPGPASRSGPVSDGLEGFARTFLLAAFRLSADGHDDPDNVAEWYAAGLAAGTDPGHPYRWPDLVDLDQAKVECASIALALHETRPWIWDRLDDGVRQRIVDWMSAMNGVFVWDNNWLWFRAVTEAFLRSVGAPVNQDDIDLAIARTDEWYVGDGWYSDGPEPHLTPGREHLRNFDNYNGWAMHFYPLWYCRMSGQHAEPGLLDRYRARLRRFLADAQYLVGADGAPLLQGRSLTYRYAMLAPFWAGAIFDATPLAPGLTRRLASGVVKHFVSNGCFDERGLQTLGWYRAFPRIRQNYSGPGSPYWSSKGFAGLVLPADHPVWTDAEEAMPVERADVAATLTAPGWVVSGTRDDGVVRLACHGGDHADPRRPGPDDPVYARLAFSTHAAPQLSDEARAEPVDSHTALLDSAGRPSLRRPSRRLLVAGRVGVSRYRAHWALGDDRYLLGPWVTTASVLRGAVEVRLARVDPAAPAGEPDAPWRLRFGGWALADSERPAKRRGGAANSPVAWVRRGDGLASTVAGLRGLTRAGVVYASGADPLGVDSAVPWVATGGPVAFGEVYAAVVVLSGAVAGTEAAGGVAVSVGAGGGTVSVGAGGGTVSLGAGVGTVALGANARAAEVLVRWADGETDRVTLDPP